MTLHLTREKNELKKRLLELGELVKKSLAGAIMAARTGDAMLAEQIIKDDVVIDAKEVEIEDVCLRLLALHQPVATDLRLIIAILKMNHDLERIGDLAVSISWRAKGLAESTGSEDYPELWLMGETASKMVHRSLEALINIDSKLAREICGEDNQIDITNREIEKKIQNHIVNNPQTAVRLFYLLNITRSFERIADHATSIAEDVIYLAEGGIVRHGGGSL